MTQKSLTFKVALLTIGKTIKRLIGTVSILILVRVLTQEEFGTYKQLLLVIGLVVSIAEFSIPKSLLYFVPIANNKDERDGYLSQSFIVLTTVGIVCSALLYVFADYIAIKFSNNELKELLEIYSPVVIFLLISQNYFSYMLIALDKHKSASFSYIFIGIPNAIAIIVAVLMHLSLQQIFTISLIVIAVQHLLIVYLIVRQDVQLFKMLRKDLLIRQWRYVLPLSFTLLSGIIAVQLDKLVIAYYFTPAIFAIYAVGAMQVPLVGNLFESVNATILPKIVEYLKNGNKESVEKLSSRGSRKVSLLIFPVFCFLFLYADQIITLLYTSDYIAAASIFRIYLFVILMKISFCGTIILGSGKTGLILKTSIFTLTLNIIMNFVLVIYIGLLGPAIATVGSRLLHQGIFIIWVKTKLGYNISNIYPTKDLIRIFALSAISGLIIYPITLITLPLIILLPALSVAYLLVYMTFLLKTRMLQEEEIKLVNKYLRKFIPVKKFQQ